ncbi:MAG: primosomal protein N' [Candidatus Omnitrophica bacterium]|nr:primosomal protein N' [Candidatus Omnitrophota bacterium]MDD5488134.1 primosomal protein N' [Candidatus Omnitrophota bacterium]
MPMPGYVEVVIKLPLDRTFQYKITGKESFPPELGKRVKVPFRNYQKTGYIVALEDAPQVESPREVIDVIDEQPVLSRELIALAGWIRDNYFCSMGEAIEAMLPGTIRRGKMTMRSRIKEEPRDVASSRPHTPNTEQASVLREIRKCLAKGAHEVFLLHGITGSGKTEIYLQAMEDVLSMGKSGVMLVPEISLTPQTVERFVSRFGDKVAVLHSRMLESARFEEWERIKKGEARVVVGPRSAIFSPIKDPGLFIVDEEHEPSYKQEDAPRYHARDVAIERGRLSGAPVILGSATPSLESYYMAMNGKCKLVELTQRIKEQELPRIKIVDMRMDFDTRVGKTVISKVMSDVLQKDVHDRKQALIFLNRRGFSTFVLCPGCGGSVKCRKCDSPMVYHAEKGELICHYCNTRIVPPTKCPSCGKDELSYKGTGTQKVEKELRRIIPEARIARMDSDTMAKRGAHDRLLGDFKEHKIDVIVGTQMIAKGLDFPKVTMVGVVSADANLNLPDFRSGERTFDLITQVAGRAGRGDMGGEVVVQTFTPEHYAIAFSAKHDYHGFYAREMESRRELMLPPVVHIAKIMVRARKEEKAEKAAGDISCMIRRKMPDVDMLGPAPAPMLKLRGYYRWNILLRGESREDLTRKLREVFAGTRKKTDVIVSVDIDPMSL